MTDFSRKARLLQESGIRKIFNLIQNIQDPINFSIGQVHYDVPEAIKKAAYEAIDQGFNRYTVTQGIPELREKLKRRLREKDHKEPDDILITSGASGGIFLSMLVLIDEGDEVLIPDPYFIMYKNLTVASGGIPKMIDTYPDFKLKKEALLSALTPRSKMLILNSPNNPTGAVYTREELLPLLEVARSHRLLVLSDEIYEDFDHDGLFQSVFPLYDQAVIIKGFSKTYAMTGWRLGYVVAPKDILDKMSILQQFSYVCAPSFAQKAALVALDLDMTPFLNEYRKKRDRTVQTLRPHFQLILPQGAFYAFPQVPPGMTGEGFVQKAIQRKLLIVPGQACSEKDTHFRLSYACDDSTLQKGLDLLVQLSQ